MSSLTREEQRQLEMIECRLSADDPELARLLGRAADVAEREPAGADAGMDLVDGGRRQKWTAVVVGVLGAVVLVVGAVLDLTVLASAGLVVTVLAPTLTCLQLRPAWRGHHRRQARPRHRRRG